MMTNEHNWTEKQAGQLREIVGDFCLKAAKHDLGLFNVGRRLDISPDYFLAARLGAATFPEDVLARLTQFLDAYKDLIR